MMFSDAREPCALGLPTLLRISDAELLAAINDALRDSWRHAVADDLPPCHSRREHGSHPCMRGGRTETPPE